MVFHKGFSNYVLGTGDKDQIYISYCKSQYHRTELCLSHLREKKLQQSPKKPQKCQLYLFKIYNYLSTILGTSLLAQW